MEQNTAHALAVLRARFPHIAILFNPCDGRWYALWPKGGFMVAPGALELRERLSGLYRHRIS